MPVAHIARMPMCVMLGLCGHVCVSQDAEMHAAPNTRMSDHTYVQPVRMTQRMAYAMTAMTHWRMHPRLVLKSQHAHMIC